MKNTKKIYEQMDLPTLLEVIEHNLGTNIDSFYNQIKEVLGRDIAYTELIKNSKFLKGELKKQIGEYLKIAVKNIRHKVLYQEFDDYIKEINEAVCEHLTIVPRSDLSWYCRDCKKEGA